jgi:hypothetical protein
MHSPPNITERPGRLPSLGYATAVAAQIFFPICACLPSPSGAKSPTSCYGMNSRRTQSWCHRCNLRLTTGHHTSLNSAQCFQISQRSPTRTRRHVAQYECNLSRDNVSESEAVAMEDRTRATAFDESRQASRHKTASAWNSFSTRDSVSMRRVRTSFPFRRAHIHARTYRQC